LPPGGSLFREKSYLQFHFEFTFFAIFTEIQKSFLYDYGSMSFARGKLRVGVE
jgi:hypothetical protein